MYDNLALREILVQGRIGVGRVCVYVRRGGGLVVVVVVVVTVKLI